MRIFTDAEIISKVENLDSFDGWKKGIYDVWVRSAADSFDSFDDKAFTYVVKEEKPVFIMSRNGTTNAGSYGLKNFDQYNHAGCCVLKSNCMVYNSHHYGLHHGKPAYIEAKGFPYFRDDNKNEKVEEFGREYNDIVGANIHRAGQNSTVIKNWSTGCAVTSNLNKFLQFLAFCKSEGYPPVTLVILKEI